MTKDTGIKILIIDDEASIRDVLKASLEDEGYSVSVAKDGEEGLRMIQELAPRVVLLDVWMPGRVDGIGVLQQAKGLAQKTEFIVMSGHGTIETAVKATKLGAWDFVEKPLSIEKILILLKNICSFQFERDEKMALLNQLRQEIAIVGQSTPAMELKKNIARIASTDMALIVSGEIGSGKSLVAKNIHYLGRRAGRPFVEFSPINIPEDLMEVELLGCASNYLSNQNSLRRGKLELAQGGTLFVKEVSRLSLEAQEHLAQLLKTGRFSQLGGEEQAADIRLIVSSSEDLQILAERGQFSSELLTLLTTSLEVPALREHSEDIPVLLKHFSNLFVRDGGYLEKSFTEKTMDMMLDHCWPGNVRELRNFVERVYILVDSEVVDPKDLLDVGLQVKAQGDGKVATFKEARAQFEKEFIMRKIDENKGNISKTAEMIGLERSYLHRKIKSYGLDL